SQSLAPIDYKNDSPHDIALKIAHAIRKNSESVVFLNLNLKCGSGVQSRLRHHQVGAEILKYLKLTDNLLNGIVAQEAPVNKFYCIVYSFYPLEETLRLKPENLILLAPRVSYVQLPGNFARELKKMRRLNGSVTMRQFMRHGAFPLDNRHSLANWWGVKQLWDVHKLATGNIAKRYPDSIYNELKNLENLQTLFLYGRSDTNLSFFYNGQKNEIKQLRRVLLSRRPRILHIDDQWSQGWSEVFINMIDGQSAEKVRLDDDNHNKAFSSYQPGNQFVFDVFSNFNLENEDNKIQKIYENIRDFINNKPEKKMPEVILLDLRLFGDKEENTSAKELSGAKILNLLRKDFMGIPVIMTTASNKAWSQEKLMRLGADGYWIKECADGRSAPQDTVENYKRLLWLIDRATSDKYKFLREFDWQLKSLKSKKSDPGGKDAQWWEKMEWKKGDETAARSDFVWKTLDETLQILRTYLHHFEMNYGFSTLADQNFWHTAMIRHAATILEEIHNVNPGENASAKINDRHDVLCKELIKLRNQVSHPRGKKGGIRNSVNWKELEAFLRRLLHYLDLKPSVSADS
ncbi:MAG: response regulator, partial [Pyrinomonadaceae bacterium]